MERADVAEHLTDVGVADGTERPPNHQKKKRNEVVSWTTGS